MCLLNYKLLYLKLYFYNMNIYIYIYIYIIYKIFSILMIIEYIKINYIFNIIKYNII